jgi:hypothetical protein
MRKLACQRAGGLVSVLSTPTLHRSANAERAGLRLYTSGTDSLVALSAVAFARDVKKIRLSFPEQLNGLGSRSATA